MRRYWEEFVAGEFDGINPDKTIAVLPVAAIEQHGPHLPVGTDLLINQGMLSLLVEACPADLDIRIMPVQAVGKSNEHVWSRGTLTMTAGTALRVWNEIGVSVARSGIRKLVFVNSHGGNVDLISIVARELRVEQGMYVVKSQWSSFGHPQDLYSDLERSHGIHGGDIETSLMLYFRPELVRMDRARNFHSSAAHDPVPPTGNISYAWSADDLNPNGVVGNASAASPVKGEASARHQVKGFVRLLRDMAQVDASVYTPSICR